MNTKILAVVTPPSIYHRLNQTTKVVMSPTLRENNMQLTELQFYTNNIARFLGIVVLLSARIKCHQFITLTSALISYK